MRTLFSLLAVAPFVLFSSAQAAKSESRAPVRAASPGDAAAVDAAPSAPPVVLPGEEVSESEIRGLLGKLTELQSKQDAQEMAALIEAHKALSVAVTGPTESVNLFISSTREVEFVRMGKKQIDFDDWKKKNDERMHDIPFGQALCMQHTFLKLSIEADTDAKRRAAVPKIIAMGDEYIRAMPKMGAYARMLSEDAFGLPVAKRFGLEKRKPEGWPASPLSLASVYGILLKPARLENPKLIPTIWEARIKQERALFAAKEELTKQTVRKALESAKKTKGADLRKAEADARNKPDSGDGAVELVDKGDKFETTVLPRLLWEMGEDMYRSGLRRAGIECQFGVVMKNPEHPSRPDWLKALADKANEVAKEAGVEVPSSAGVVPASVAETAPSPVRGAPVAPVVPAPGA